MVKVTKQLYKKSQKEIQVIDEGKLKTMTQIIKEPSGKMVFDCDEDYFKKHLMSHPDYSLSKDAKDPAKAPAKDAKE